MDIFDIISQLLKEKGKTQKQLCDYLGLKPQTFTKWKNGENDSYKKRLPEISTFFDVSIDILLGKDAKPAPKKKNVLRVPVYGNVAAGIPIEAIEDIEDYEELDADKYAVGDYMALKIKGHSMEPRMMNGDVVIVRLQEDVESGDTAIVMVGGDEATCKKIKKTPEGVTLIATNPAYDPMFYSNAEILELPVRILGKVVELRAKY